MKLIPVLTEKSLDEVKKGNYTFWVDRNVTKYQIKKIVDEVYNVHVVKVRTMNQRGEKKKTVTGRIKIVQPKKKTIVTLQDKEKIDIFETKKGK